MVGVHISARQPPHTYIVLVEVKANIGGAVPEFLPRKYEEGVTFSLRLPILPHISSSVHCFSEAISIPGHRGQQPSQGNGGMAGCGGFL